VVATLEELRWAVGFFIVACEGFRISVAGFVAAPGWLWWQVCHDMHVAGLTMSGL